MPGKRALRTNLVILLVAIIAGGLLAVSPVDASAQAPSSNLGLPAVAAVGLHGGIARLERSSEGEEGGLLLDVGWLRGRSLRLLGEVAFLRARLTDSLLVEDSTFHGDYFDLSVGMSTVWLITVGRQVSPYALAGVAVHALSSTFNNSVLDQRYNANRFGSHVGAGIRLRVGPSRHALFVEWRRVIADQVDRSLFRAGGMLLMGDLYRRGAETR